MKTISQKTFNILCRRYPHSFNVEMSEDAIEKTITHFAKPLVNLAVSENNTDLLYRVLKVEAVVRDTELMKNTFLVACQNNLFTIARVLQVYQTSVNLVYGFINAIQNDHNEIVRNLLKDTRITSNKKVLQDGLIIAVKNERISALSVFINSKDTQAIDYSIIVEAYDMACDGANVVVMEMLFSELGATPQKTHLNALLEKVIEANNLVLFKYIAEKYASIFYAESRAEIYKKALDGKSYKFIQWFLSHKENSISVYPYIEHTLQRAFSGDEELKSLVLNSTHMLTQVKSLPENNERRIDYFLNHPQMGQEVDKMLTKLKVNAELINKFIHFPEARKCISVTCNDFVEKLLQEEAFPLLDCLVNDRAVAERIAKYDVHYRFFISLLKKAQYGLLSDYVSSPGACKQMICLLEANYPGIHLLMEYIVVAKPRRLSCLWRIPQVQKYFERHAHWILRVIFSHPVLSAVRKNVFRLPAIMDIAKQADPFIYPEYQPYITRRILDLRVFNSKPAPIDITPLLGAGILAAEDRESKNMILSLVEPRSATATPLYGLWSQQAQRAVVEEKRPVVRNRGSLC